MVMSPTGLRTKNEYAGDPAAIYPSLTAPPPEVNDYKNIRENPITAGC
jgi:hypothetical protein